VTANEFRNLALGLPEAIESAHMGHPDFRVAGKIFATLGHTKGCGMVKLTPSQQADVVAAEPEIFQPVKGGWGRQGATTAMLATATEESLRRALVAAWRNAAPKRLSHLVADE
jgi:hypothetical protein